MIHPIDRLGGTIVSRGPDRLRFFTDGWGDLSEIQAVDLPSGNPPSIPIEWVSDTAGDGIRISVGIFESPVAMLPDHARHGAVT
ncbi:MAG: hypothetical protein MUQ27_05960, partial [Acidimicrobiia bacterium]|nr:hypothetical protein [Acidimicrobiia bacterium]